MRLVVVFLGQGQIQTFINLNIRSGWLTGRYAQCCARGQPGLHESLKGQALNGWFTKQLDGCDIKDDFVLRPIDLAQALDQERQRRESTPLRFEHRVSYRPKLPENQKAARVNLSTVQ
jgi:hypothetical protein